MSKRQEKTGNMQVISDAIFVQEMPKHLLTEYPRLLKHKNVSPHGLYMLYRSLFDTLKWEIRGRDTAA